MNSEDKASEIEAMPASISSGFPQLGQGLRPARPAGVELLRHGPACGVGAGVHDLPGRPARGAGRRGHAWVHAPRDFSP
jgi:hypothetical protein